MSSYKIVASLLVTGPSVIVRNDGAMIPLSQTNMDCHGFLCDWRDGAAVTDEAGAGMAYSEAAVQAFGLTPVAAEQA